MIITDADKSFDYSVPVVVVGGGGCGLCAALAASDEGADVLVIERDATPSGSTGMSTGLIPAAGTPEQASAGIDDSGRRFSDDVIAKAGAVDVALVERVANESAETVAWLQRHDVPLTLLDGFTYAGHSVRRMFGTPRRTGAELIAALLGAVERSTATMVTGATVETLFVDAARCVRGVGFKRPDGSVEEVGCGSLILACSGYGGNSDLVRRLIPEVAEAHYHGHPGNRGDALLWGQALGARIDDTDAYQGHGNLALGHGIILNWPSVIEGGFQLNVAGERFYDESIGYSAAAAQVNRQERQTAWTIFDRRIETILEQFEDYADARHAGAVIEAEDLATLAVRTRLPEAAIGRELAAIDHCLRTGEKDRFGRNFTGGRQLQPPYRAVRVTGALLHTQGGLAIDGDARVLSLDGSPLPNLFAGGGAARGISGPGSKGYIAGNGLVTATTLGKLAGRAAARQALVEA